MSNEKVWVSNIIRKHDFSWADYSLSVDGKIDSLLLEQYRHVLSKEERQKIKPKYDESLDNYIDLTDNFTRKKN